MIRLKEAGWSNMFSYGESNSIQLSKAPITQLIGANGFGKSSIPLILEEILFNTNSKKIKKGDILNRYSKNKFYEGWVEFDIDNDNYKVVTRRSGTQVVKLYKNGEDISMHTATATYKLIETILGIDAKSFEQLIYQRNSASLEFLTATDTVRKRFLIDLLGLSIYTEYFDLFKDLSKSANDVVNITNGKVDTVKAWLERISKESLEPREPIPVPEAIDHTVEIGRLNSEIKNIETINKSIAQNNQYKKILDSIDLSILNINESLTGDIELINNTVAKLTLLIKQDKDLNNKLNSLGETCPTCLQPVSAEFVKQLFDEIHTRLESNKQELSQKTIEASKYAASKSILEKQRHIQSEFEKYSQLYDKTKPTELLDKDDLQKSLAKLVEETAIIYAARNNALETNLKIQSHNSKINTLIAQANSYRDELQQLELQLNILKEKYVNLELLKKVFSTTGFIAYKLENLVIELQNIANEYLSVFSAGRFELTFQVENDKLNVIIIDNGNPISVEALSSGELARVNTSTLLAIRKLMSSISKTKINLLILDETIDTLDVFGKEQLVEILLNELELNTFIVSHGFTHPLLEKITVIKEKNISRLE